MADKSLIEQMLERLVNEDQAKAEELFHEYVVAKSREIYEELIESEISDEEVEESAEEEDEEEKVDESSDEDEDKEDEKMDEEFDEIAVEADDEMDLEPGDATDDLAGEIGDDEEGEDMGEKSEEELFQDLDAIVDELQAKFDELKGGDMGDMDSEEGEMKDALEPELATVREYVEKVATPKGGDNGANAKSVVAGKNDMGGTTANIVKGGEEPTSASTKGGLLNPSPKEDNAGNINVPGGKAGSAFSKKEPGHGAEKKGAAEQADNKQSLFRGRR